ALGQPGQIGGVEFDVTFADAKAVTGVQPVDLPGPAFDKIRVGAQGQREVFDVGVVCVPDAQ
nr:hypothetical protein [Tanacetum cinerariifolium]